MLHTKILLIEDDDVDYLIVKKAFEKINMVKDLYRVDNALSACDLLESGVFDVSPCIILLDLNMPKMSGLEFLEWLRNSSPERYRNTPVVVLTTSNDPIDKKHSFQYCIGGYIIKPVESEVFVDSMAVLGQYWSLCKMP